MKYSTLMEKITVHDGPFPYTTREYEWWGENDYVWIPKRHWNRISLPHVGQVVQVGSYRLRIVDEDFARDSFLAIRYNGMGSITRAFVYHVGRLFRPVKDRFIITLAVWGAASYSDGRVPSVHDIYLVQRASRIVKRLRTKMFRGGTDE